MTDKTTLPLKDIFTAKTTQVTVEYYLGKFLDGSDYERGELETLSAGLNNVHEAFGRLVQTLVDTGKVKVEDVPFIAGRV